ncbi:MAG: SpoVA/SpoVAEb family sporulation membrane protein [Ruminococcus sp.]|jgi:stage V sporulation protein AC|nr:SpoVA/SpoVAEb family sporulation membrane protein [Ruminococcus sp.]
MTVTKTAYAEMVKKASDNSHAWVDTLKAFVIGGAICCIGQVFINIFETLGVSPENSPLCASMLLIVITAFLTGFGVFGKIARHAGAGTLVPITGFANAVVSPALEFKSEGYVLGLGAKIFVIAGPVIFYGTAAAFLYGVVYWIFS